MIANLIFLLITIIGLFFLSYMTLKNTPTVKKLFFVGSIICTIVITYGISTDVVPKLKQLDELDKNVQYIPAPKSHQEIDPPTEKTKVKMYPFHEDSL